MRYLIATICMLVIAGLAQAGDAARVVFVAGKAEMAGIQIALGDSVSEKSEIVTGADGYVYLKTIDNGFLILRPRSHARIVAYHVDADQPANTRIKIELLNGVARTISGEGAKQARQNFRFNTPVAAIGVRGTDFTVYTDQETSRVAVLSGGVVVSGFTGACGPEGVGPCEGAVSRELFAKQAGQLLQVSKGQPAPQLLQGSSNSPDTIAPPRGDEPSGKSANASVGSAVPLKDLDPQKSVELDVLATKPVPEAPRQVLWGRWQQLLNQSATIDLTKEVDVNKGKIIALNSYFALVRTAGNEWRTPDTGTLNFALKESAAYIADEARGGLLSAAQVENGKLSVDFGKATFSTSIDLVSQAERFKLQATGDVGKDGQLYGVNQFQRPTNMGVSGIVSPENGGRAAYLFQSRLDGTRTATGATYWGTR